MSTARQAAHRGDPGGGSAGPEGRVDSPGSPAQDSTAHTAGRAAPATARRRRAVAVVVVVAVLAAGGVAVAVTRPFSGSGRPGTGASAATQTAVVTRQTLTAQTAVNATLGYAGSYKVTGTGKGTLTWLPSLGQVIRQGQVLYRVDNGTPVVLLYGRVPDWRTLGERAKGADVAQLNHDLVALGYADRGYVADLGWDYFSWETKYALEQYQHALGVTETGTLALGSVVFLPRAIRVSSVTASLGSPASGPVYAATGAQRMVTIALDVAQESEVKPGDRVTVTLPDGRTTPGVVSSVGQVASSSSGGSATVPVQVALTDPAAAGSLVSAPVTVSITTASARNALVVPVAALLARPSGYAVEVAAPGGHHRLIPVIPGLFDDSAGLVQVSGPGLAAGQRVVVPAP